MNKGFHGQPKGMTPEQYIKHLESTVERLKAGGCRFNCRTNKEAFFAGYNAAQEPGDFVGKRFHEWTKLTKRKT